MFLSRIETTLLSQFKQKLQSDIHNSSKWFYYRMYKTDHKFEKYFDIIDGKLQIYFPFLDQKKKNNTW